jgi:UDP-N-acetylglucosamine:LPS N-acetylglucosamine transferase
MARKKIIGISSPGGHLSELIKAIPSSYENEVVYITFKNGHTKETLKDKAHFFVIDPHVTKIKFLINFMQSFFLYVKIRPKVIISTGAGIALPLILIGKFLKTKIIFIESGARIFKPSKTASFIYKFSDLFIIQYETLHSFFPKSKIGSL